MIISVGLVKPKPDVFVKEIEYLLVLATPLEITLIGLSLNADKTQIKYYPTQLAVPSDNVNMLNISTTDSGRIFMCGSDGNLYELMYQAEEGWFTRKCRKLNHTSNPLSIIIPTFLRFNQDDPIFQMTVDSSRNLLFTISEQNIIQAFHIIDEEPIKVAQCSDIFDQAIRLCPRTSLLNKKNFNVTGIHAISKSESTFVNLVAVTSNGIRLYFSTLGRQYRDMDRRRISVMNFPSSTLELIHVRLPPENSVQPPDYKRLVGEWISNIHSSYYRSGVFLAANAFSEEEDSVWGISLNQSQISTVNFFSNF